MGHEPVQVVMFAWGNPSRGDDAVGSWFAQRFRHRVGSSFQLVEDFQLQVEHLLDCREGELLLFVDACCNGVASHSFGELTPCPELGHTSHALTPAELLGQYSKLFAAPAPASFLLQVPGRQFELGEPMSAATRTCCETAAKLVERLLDAPQRDIWRTLCTPAERPARRKISARSAPVQPSAAP